MSGIKGRSGRRKPLGKQIDEAMKRLDAELPDLVAKLILKASDGDRDALIYLIDRRMGKPKQSTDIDITGGVELGKTTILEIFRQANEARRRLVEPSTIEYNELGEGKKDG